MNPFGNSRAMHLAQQVQSGDDPWICECIDDILSLPLSVH